MLGIVLFLHFGLFDLLALAWLRAGINARPIMQAPLRARSLAEFWGSRWNTAFSDLARQFIFRPLAKTWGARGAMAGVFLVSGLVHEAVISLPARGGYGLPTAYFALQALGMLLERSEFGRAFGLCEGFRGRLFMAIFAGAPAYWLFHPVFVRNVILPMLDFIGAK
jgi:alginate O-acetyltransferase complex protein AlgI